MLCLKVERSQLLIKFYPGVPAIVFIDTQINELEALIRRSKV
jgi:hypothetical protein